MNNRDFKDIGDEIKNIVQDAIGTNNFQHLNEDISRTIHGALNEVRRATSDIRREFEYRTSGNQDKIDREYKYENSKDNSTRDDKSSNVKSNSTNSYNTSSSMKKDSQVVYNHRTRTYERKPVNSSDNGNNTSYTQSQKIKNYNQNNLVKLNGNVGRISAILFTVFGAVGSLGFGITTIVFAILNQFLVGIPIYNILLKIFLVAFLGCMTLLSAGSRIRNRMKRFQRYVHIINGRNYCMIKEFVDRTEFSKRYIIRDLKKMIESGMFVEGNLDEKYTCLMLNKEAYDLYISAKDSLDARQKETTQALKDNGTGKDNKEEPKSGQNSELEKVLKEGHQYIYDIRKANDLIIDIDVSLKLDRMEHITIKIFNYIERNPRKVKEIRKFLEYYLPTTIKLLQAYIKFDEELIQGDNIKTAKSEIVGTLDTINTAFENLLDDLYEDEAMDISTDISVLETMLMQEGLTGKDFDVK